MGDSSEATRGRIDVVVCIKLHDGRTIGLSFYSGDVEGGRVVAPWLDEIGVESVIVDLFNCSCTTRFVACARAVDGEMT